MASIKDCSKNLKREEIYASEYHDFEHLRQSVEEFIDRYQQGR